MDLKALKELAYKAAEENIGLYNNVCNEIFTHPELGNREHYSSAFLTSEMEKLGFRVQYPYCGLETAFRCEIGSGSPKVAFLAEYDALPGYGPNNDQNGHACGHNWIAACTFGAADVLRRISEHFDGTVVFIGTPAEEGTGGKVDLVNAGCFDDIDAVFQAHLTGGKTQLNSRTLAIDSVEFTFEGVAAHASGNPWKGVNALDASYLTFTGINALRQHMTPDARVHGIIEEGGVAPNIVPSHCVCKFFVRAADRDYLTELTRKVINCAKGAELMTGAKMSWRYFENSFDDLRCNPVLIDLMAKNLKDLGYDDFTTEEAVPSGSSDLGNVARVCPTCYLSLNAGNTDGSNCHEEAFLSHVNSETAYGRNLLAVKAMAATALDFLCDENVRKAIAK